MADDGTQPAIILLLEIENHYEEIEMVTTHATVHVPPPPSDGDDLSDWEYDHIFSATGTGHETGDSSYFVKVTESSNPDLIPVGTEYEFGL